MSAEKKLRAHMEGSETIDILTDRLIEARIRAAHNKIRRNDNIGIRSDADLLNDLESSGIGRRELGRLFMLEALYLNILILDDLAQVLLDILGGGAGHHSEVRGDRRFLRKNIGGRAALSHSNAGSCSDKRSRRRNLLHDELRERFEQPEVAGNDSDGICSSSAEV